MAKPPTVRERLYAAIDSTYMYCRDNSFRTPNIIKEAQDILCRDTELVAFFEHCLQQDCDPRYNPVFGYYDEAPHCWPDRSGTTLDDDDTDVLTDVASFEQDVKQILEIYQRFPGLIGCN